MCIKHSSYWFPTGTHPDNLWGKYQTRRQLLWVLHTHEYYSCWRPMVKESWHRNAIFLTNQTIHQVMINTWVTIQAWTNTLTRTHTHTHTSTDTHTHAQQCSVYPWVKIRWYRQMSIMGIYIYIHNVIGVSEAFTRILRRLDSRVAHTPVGTLRGALFNWKNCSHEKDETGTVNTISHPK